MFYVLLEPGGATQWGKLAGTVDTKEGSDSDSTSHARLYQVRILLEFNYRADNFVGQVCARLVSQLPPADCYVLDEPLPILPSDSLMKLKVRLFPLAEYCSQPAGEQAEVPLLPSLPADVQQTARSEWRLLQHQF